jgi:hypothetical protein
MNQGNFYNWNTYIRKSDGKKCEAIGFTGGNIDKIRSIVATRYRFKMEILEDDKGLIIRNVDGSTPLHLNHQDWLVWDGEEFSVWNPKSFSSAFVSEVQ